MKKFKKIHVCLKSDASKTSVIQSFLPSLAKGAVKIFPKIDNIGYWNLQELNITKVETE
jgi:hypothetical protein